MKKARTNQKKLEDQIPTESNPSDFHFEITKIAISQICQSVGFKSAQLASLQTLSRMATLYIKSLAEAAALYSNRSNRTQSNIFDLIHALHDLSLPQGFLGASTHHRNCLLSSPIMEDLSDFVKIKDEIPFARPIPRPAPATSSIPIPPQQRQMLNPVIPEWLPKFPEESTLKPKAERRRARSWENSEMVTSCGEIEREKKIKQKKNVNNRDLKIERERMSFKINQL